jgi:hypothetical protein
MTYAPTDTDTTTLTVLRLHTDALGNVWYGQDGRMATDSHCQAAEFVERAARLGVRLEDVDCVRLIGAAVNARLVRGLYRPGPGRTAPRIQLFSPDLCLGGPERGPEYVLQVLWQPCHGGVRHWHYLSDRDYSSYGLVAAVQDAGGNPDDKCVRLLRYHPAWPALSFPLSHDPYSACCLVATLVDPRWFRCRTHPHRLGRLHAYLGMTPVNATACETGSTPGRHFDRFLTALYAWCGRTSCWGGNARSEPRNFLSRIGLSKPDRGDGLLAATVRYLRLVVEVWLDGVCVRHHPDVCFSPVQFFKQHDEIEAFTSHRARLLS